MKSKIKLSKEVYIKMECLNCRITFEFLKEYQEKFCPICLNKLKRSLDGD
jgi:rRNA maturation endonuclease Nob1